jgi:hypothetical protein
MALKKSVSVNAMKKTFLERILPIPQEFYAGNKEEDLIIPKKQIIPMAIVLQFMQWGAFIAFFTYYSLPPSFIRESTIQADWDFGGSSWNCTPMMAHGYYATRWNYATCQGFVQPPSETTVTLSQNVKPDPGAPDGEVSGPAWRYHPFHGTGTGAKAVLGPAEKYMADPSLTEDAVSEKIRQVIDPVKELNACGLDGFLQQAYSFKSGLVKDEGFTFDIYSPNLALTSTPPPPAPPPPAPATVSVCCGGTTYLDDEPSCQRGVFEVSGARTQCSNFENTVFVGDDIDGIAHTNRYVTANMIYDKGFENQGAWVTHKQNDDDIAAQDPNVNSGATWADTNEGIDETDSAQYDSSSFEYIYRWTGSDGERQPIYNCIRCCTDVDCGACCQDNSCAAASCCDCGGDMWIDPEDDPTNPEYFTLNYGLPAGHYEDCETTQAEAIAMFKSYLERHDPCEWTKHNGPFNCERAGPLGVGQRFSLAYANALLAYTLVSAAIVNLFFAAQKRKAEGKDVEEGEGEEEFTEVAAVEANK